MGVEIMKAKPTIDYIVLPIGDEDMVAVVVANCKETHLRVKIIVNKR